MAKPQHVLFVQAVVEGLNETFDYKGLLTVEHLSKSGIIDAFVKLFPKSIPHDMRLMEVRPILIDKTEVVDSVKPDPIVAELLLIDFVAVTYDNEKHIVSVVAKVPKLTNQLVTKWIETFIKNHSDYYMHGSINNIKHIRFERASESNPNVAVITMSDKAKAIIDKT